MKNPFKKYICIKQHDLKDCGAACLATISKQYGLKIPISKIREVAGNDKHFTSIKFIFINVYESEVFISLIILVIVMKYINYLENNHI